MTSFNGHELETLFYVGRPELRPLSAVPVLSEIPGKNGSVLDGFTWGNASASMEIAILGDNFTRRNAVSMLAQWLTVSEPGKLVLNDTPDRYYLAVPDGDISFTRLVNGDIGILNFTIIEPAAYGEIQLVTVEESAQFVVRGTYPTKPVITSQAVPDSNGIWGIILDDDTFVHLELPGSGAVVIDCANRVCTYEGAATLPTLESDWLEFETGVHSVSIDYGTGGAIIEYPERWY